MSTIRDIKDYLHLYGLGLEVMFDNKTWVIEYLKERVVRLRRKEGEYHRWVECFYDELIIPLRPLSDMTEEEKKEAFKDFGIITEGDISKLVKDCSAAINYLRERNIDCDGLIEAGLALDKTKINKS